MWSMGVVQILKPKGCERGFVQFNHLWQRWASNSSWLFLSCLYKFSIDMVWIEPNKSVQKRAAQISTCAQIEWIGANVYTHTRDTHTCDAHTHTHTNRLDRDRVHFNLDGTPHPFHDLLCVRQVSLAEKTCFAAKHITCLSCLPCLPCLSCLAHIQWASDYGSLFCVCEWLGNLCDMQTVWQTPLQICRLEVDRKRHVVRKGVVCGLVLFANNAQTSLQWEFCSNVWSPYDRTAELGNPTPSPKQHVRLDITAINIAECASFANRLCLLVCSNHCQAVTTWQFVTPVVHTDHLFNFSNFRQGTNAAWSSEAAGR